MVTAETTSRRCRLTGDRLRRRRNRRHCQQQRRRRRHLSASAHAHCHQLLPGKPRRRRHPRLCHRIANHTTSEHIYRYDVIDVATNFSILPLAAWWSNG